MRTYILIATVLAPLAAYADEIEFAPERMRPFGPQLPPPKLAPAKDKEPVRTATAAGDDADSPFAAPTPTVVDRAPETIVKSNRWIEPHGAIAGGVHLQSLNVPSDVQTGTQNPTIAVSRLGVRGGVGKYITFAS